MLAGGRSTRFGADKLATDLDGAPLLQHAVRRVAQVCGEVVVVCAPDAAAPTLPTGVIVRLARDAREGEGPLAGLSAGLAAVDTHLALVAAGDMPDMAPAVLVEMLRVAEEAAADAVALRDGAAAGPLPCVVRTETAGTNANALLQDGQRSLLALLDRMQVAVIEEETWRALDPAGGTLRDIDTPSDLAGR